MICPFCKEEIKDASTICEFCESSITDQPCINVDVAALVQNLQIHSQPIVKNFFAKYTLKLASCFGGCIALIHLLVFKFVPIAVHLLYIPFVSYVFYMIYMKYFRRDVQCISRSISRTVWWSGLGTMFVIQYLFAHKIAIGAVSSIVSLMTLGFPAPFIGTAINYHNRQREIDIPPDMIVPLNAIPALEGIAILLLVSIAIRLTKTSWELGQQGIADPFAKAAGLASAVNLGLSQLTLGMRGKGNFDDSSVQDETLREKLRLYPSVSPQEQCFSCDYTGPMGVIKTHVPWYLSWWLLIPLACTGVGLVWVAIAVTLRFWKQRLVVECPKCGVSLEARRN